MAGGFTDDDWARWIDEMEAAPPPLAWVWSGFRAEFPQTDAERLAQEEMRTVRAWVWSQFSGELPQTDRERQAMGEAPTPFAWVWSQFKGELPQTDRERQAIGEAPTPVAWVWSQYRGELPQAEEEAKACAALNESLENLVSPTLASTATARSPHDDARPAEADRVPTAIVMSSPRIDASERRIRTFVQQQPGRTDHRKPSRLQYAARVASIALAAGFVAGVIWGSSGAGSSGAHDGVARSPAAQSKKQADALRR